MSSSACPPQAAAAAAASPSADYLTEQDVQNYGNELIDVTQRAALHAVAPQLQELEQQNAELQAAAGEGGTARSGSGGRAGGAELSRDRSRSAVASLAARY